MEELFYFICHPQGDKSKIEVIDEQQSLHYEKYHFALVNDLEWNNVKDAIEYAKKLAEKYNLEYIPFESRCGYDEDEIIDKVTQDLKLLWFNYQFNYKLLYLNDS